MIRAYLATALLAAMLTGCTVPIALPDAQTCNSNDAIGYVGQRYTQRIGRIVKDKTQSTYVRTIATDTMVTQEFRANRVNLALDERNTVTRIYCG